MLFAIWRYRDAGLRDSTFGSKAQFGMNYSNFDLRLQGNFTIPEDRLEKVRLIEERIRESRLRKRREKRKTLQRKSAS